MTAQTSVFKDPRTMMNRGQAVIWLTIRSILFDRKTMALGAILLLLLALPVVWQKNNALDHEKLGEEKIDEEKAAMDFFVGIMAMIYLQFIVLYTCFL